MGVTAANWGNVISMKGNEDARTDPETGSAYEVIDEPGTVAKGRLGVPAMSDGMEPHAVWLLVVGSIGSLWLLSRLFRSAKA